MSAPRGHVALLVDFANLRQQLQTTAEAGDDPTGSTTPRTDAIDTSGVGPASLDAASLDAASQDADGASADAATIAGDGNPAELAGADGAPSGRDTAAIARSLVRFAGSIGRVGLARAYADWSREPELARRLNGTCLAPILVPATEDGEDRSHIRLVVDAMEALYNGDEPEAFVIVSSDPSLVPLLQAIRADGSEVVLVAADEAAADELRAESDQFANFEDVLTGCVGEAVEPRGFGERVPGGRDRGGAQGRRQRGNRGEARDRGYYSSKPLLTESNFESYDWDGFIGLIDELEQRLPFVGVRYLVNKVLGPHNCGIDDPHIKRDLINEAVDDGLIEMYSVGNVNDRTDPVTACRLDRRNPRVVHTLGPDLAEETHELLPEDAAGEYSTSSP